MNVWIKRRQGRFEYSALTNNTGMTQHRGLSGAVIGQTPSHFGSAPYPRDSAHYSKSILEIVIGRETELRIPYGGRALSAAACSASRRACGGEEGRGKDGGPRSEEGQGKVGQALIRGCKRVDMWRLDKSPWRPEGRLKRPPEGGCHRPQEGKKRGTRAWMEAHEVSRATHVRRRGAALAEARRAKQEAPGWAYSVEGARCKGPGGKISAWGCRVKESKRIYIFICAFSVRACMCARSK